MKRLTLLLIISFVTILGSVAQNKTFYDFKVKTLEGEDFDFAWLKGKKVMVVNTASKCGNTPQYEGLQELYSQYGGDTFVIIGFPANNFLGQEPGSNSEIRQFCTENYGVTFPMMAKISVKGDDIHPVYQWLTSKERNGIMDSEVTWNFQKFLINEEGQLEKVIKPRGKPLSDGVVGWVIE